MDERRWITVKGQANRNRKSVCILNDLERARLEEYDETLKREKDDIIFRMQQNIQPMKLLLAQRRSLQKCLELRQKAAKEIADEKRFGKYNGMSLDDMRDDIETYISTNQPQLRRLRHVRRLLTRGQSSGKLLDYDSANLKIHELFDKFHREREILLAEWRKKHSRISDGFQPLWTSSRDFRRMSLATSTRKKRTVFPPLGAAKHA